MKTQRIKFEKQVVMALTSILLLGSGCEDRIDTRGNSSVGEGTPVDVAFRIGLADETDAYTLSATPESKALAAASVVPAFGYVLCPSIGTKAAISLKPAALYNLEIRQYGSDGSYIGGSETVIEEVVLGSQITATLQTATKCHLVLVAWGKENTTDRLGTVTLSKAQEKSVSGSYITALNSSEQADMNKMPYMLHLEDVNVSDDGRIYSADGEAVDIRLLLRRLAARLTVDWTYNVQISGSTYKLSRILLQSIPSNYNVIPVPDASSGNTYPSLLDQFTTVELDEADIVSGSYSCWLPANVRGTSPQATSLFYRYKKNAPVGSSYIDFQATNQSNAKQKLNYRVYLGENTSTDFNLHDNTDYTYTVNIKHTELPNNDLRVTIIDPIAASENNENRVLTANCFMVQPGTAFCFDPFTYHQDGIDIENATLKGWASSNGEGGIASVELLWQTKENGDVGDPVIGTVNSTSDHTNIVEVKKNDGTSVSSASPLTAKDQGRIYCRVAPNTTGGSGLIAARNVKGEIIWSWHIWVTAYNPESVGNATVMNPENKRKLKFTYNNSNQLPMMDRNLGAMAGYTVRPSSPLAMSKANGFHYQWGRKDPFPSSYSKNQIKMISNVDSDTPVPDMLNLYGPDGLKYIKKKGETKDITYRDAFKEPITFYYWGQVTGWRANDCWGGISNKKSISDPCPAGWFVASKENFKALFIGSYVYDQYCDANATNQSTSLNDGGYIMYFEGNSTGNTCYFRMPGYRPKVSEFLHIGQWGFIWTRNKNGASSAYALNILSPRVDDSSKGVNMRSSMETADAHTIRCIQERE